MSIKTTKPVEDTEKLGGRAPEYYVPERIENENGTAIKFADGTLICMKTVTVGDIDLTAHIGATYTHNYAISLGGFAFPFVGACYRSKEVSITNTTNTPIWLSTLADDSCWVTGSAQIKVKDVKIHILAVGKWK